MRVKFRLCLDDKGARVTRVFFVNDDKSLELLTQMPGWIGIDFDTMDQTSIDKIAQDVANNVDKSKYIE